jgi:hypothetical protein
LPRSTAATTVCVVPKSIPSLIHPNVRHSEPIRPHRKTKSVSREARKGWKRAKFWFSKTTNFHAFQSSALRVKRF